MIRYVVGNLLEASEEVIVHGVNARGAFGSGVAGAMAAAWPEARESYLRAYSNGLVGLGRLIWAEVGGNRILAHAVTQPTYGRTGVHLSMPALKACMGALAAAAVVGTGLAPNGFRSIAMPKIGAGLAGGDWREIEPVIEETLSDLDVAIYVLSPREIPAWRSEVPARAP